MTKKLLLISLFILCYIPVTHASDRLWEIQSVDTMKTSRDLTLYKRDDPKFDQKIKQEIEMIKELGATHVTIDGAYDQEFIPWTKRWEQIARQKKLNVWYRGNFSAWHGWFGPKGMTREEHIQMARKFLIENQNLFQNNDGIVLCPECEWGGPGNPVETGDYLGYRNFMIDEYKLMNEIFQKSGKKIYTNWFSINPDVGKQALDHETVSAVNDVITLDYFIKDTAQLEDGLDYFHEKFPNAKLFIGEFGAPIPEINGKMTEEEQADFVDQIFFELYKRKKYILGINYWVSSGGATGLLNDDYSKRKVYDVVKKYFRPGIVQGIVTDTHGKLLSGVNVQAGDGVTHDITNANGEYKLILPAKPIKITYIYPNHISQSTIVQIKSDYQENRNVKLTSIVKKISFLEWMKNLFLWRFNN